LLHRPRGAEWTPADVPLLDEAAELLGEDDTEAKARAERRRRQAIDYAQGVLDILDLEDDADPDILMATDLVDAYRLAERHGAERYETAAERAAADRTWTFGHVIVDEAQELSAMAWRTLMRRCPSKSMTVVGDIAQTGDIAGASSWDDVLSPYVMDRWKLTELTVNYRTPSEIMAVAADVLASVDPDLAPPTSVRDSGFPPWSLRVPSPADVLPELVEKEVASIGDGKLAVIVPAASVEELRAAVPGASDDLDAQVVVLGVVDAKGLEFDSVLVVDPSGILAESPRGASDLYVALTRATQRLGVVHADELPDVLGRLAPTG
ncbi:ATP-binding domain-containing protein, partial [Saccharothrix sp. MB29]|nr:ATP-binding domain-containing protein [Saccharothrix sp. MB29]